MRDINENLHLTSGELARATARSCYANKDNTYLKIWKMQISALKIRIAWPVAMAGLPSHPYCLYRCMTTNLCLKKA
jgi:hypothetical protein